MNHFLQRRASTLIEEARRLAAEGQWREACRRLSATCEFLRRSFGPIHRELPELFQLLSDLHITLGESKEAEQYQIRSWELRYIQERYIQRLFVISRLAGQRTFAAADLGRWPRSVEAVIEKIRNDALSDVAPELIIFGPPQSGKTHLLHALGHEAVHRPWPTRLYLGYELLESLMRARRSLRLHRYLYRLDRYAVLLIDELDPWNLSPEEAEALHTVLLYRRDHRCTMVAVCTERRLAEEGEVLASLQSTRGLRYLSPKAVLLGLACPPQERG